MLGVSEVEGKGREGNGKECEIYIVLKYDVMWRGMALGKKVIFIIIFTKNKQPLQTSITTTTTTTTTPPLD